jgi:hypothetical protein
MPWSLSKENTLRSHCPEHQDVGFNIAECENCMKYWAEWQTEQLDKRNAEKEEDRKENRRYKPRITGRGRSSDGT